MKSTKLTSSNKKTAEYSGEILVTCVFQDKGGKLHGDKVFKPVLKAIADYREFTGKKNQTLQLYDPGDHFGVRLACRRLVLLGLGDPSELSSQAEIFELLRSAGGTIAGLCEKNKITVAGVVLPRFPDLGEERVAQHLIEGTLLGDYSFRKHKKEDKEQYRGLKRIELFSLADKKEIIRGLTRGSNSADASCVARDMANEPGNFWTPTHFAEYGRKIAKKHNLKCTILDKSHMTKLKMGGILAVNQGSKEPPKMVILDYNPAEYSETILLVGKGLTFDSGGISLKPPQNMMDMKYDMCGGAAVMSAIEAIAVENHRVRVVAIVPSTDNMAGGAALKPGDVVTHYGGITSEIENTDAEGRLILADALAYGIKKYKPDCVIDLATLTGAVIIALGHHFSGLVSNNDQLAKNLLAAGDISGEPVWRLPLGPDYREQLKSEVADVKNTGGRPAGCITAGEYLHRFVGDTPWAHLDIAGTAWNFTEKTYIPKGPSGIGVRTLIELVRGWEAGLVKAKKR